MPIWKNSGRNASKPSANIRKITKNWAFPRRNNWNSSALKTKKNLLRFLRTLKRAEYNAKPSRKSKKFKLCVCKTNFCKRLSTIPIIKQTKTASSICLTTITVTHLTIILTRDLTAGRIIEDLQTDTAALLTCNFHLSDRGSRDNLFFPGLLVEINLGQQNFANR